MGYAAMRVRDPSQRFFLHGGGALESLEDLFTELQTMEDEVFNHHVTAERNDFATWVRDVFKDPFLARHIELSREKDQLCKLLFINLFR